jgi:hypothetical protein
LAILVLYAFCSLYGFLQHTAKLRAIGHVQRNCY